MEQTVLIGGIYQMFRNEETSDYFVVIAEGTVAYLGFDVFETRTDGISNTNVVHSMPVKIINMIKNDK